MQTTKQSRRGDTTERLTLIPFMLAERAHTRQELADYFRVDAKTISRNIEKLSLRHPILPENQGREVLYRLISDRQYKTPNFTPAELATLLLAQQSIAATGVASFGTPFAGYGQSLLQKVRTALPASLRAKLDALSTIFGTAQTPAKDFAPYAETIDQLTNAALERRRVRMRYYTLHNDKVNDRAFDPYNVYFDPDGATLKVIGHDHQSQEVRPFAIDHIRGLKLTPEKFERPPKWDLHEYLDRYCFNGFHGEPLKVRLRAYGKTARVFAERRFHSSQEWLERSAEATTIEMTVARGRGLVRFILSWLPDVEVLSPPELRQEVAQTLQEAGQRFF